MAASAMRWIRIGSVGCAIGALAAASALSLAAQSGAVAGPQPLDGATGVNVSTTLSWDAVPGASSYGLMFGLNERDLDSPALFATGIRAAEPRVAYQLPPLAANRRYYWRVVVNEALPGAVPGPVWSFTTATPAPETVWGTVIRWLPEAGIIAGILAVLKWLRERNSRATDVLLELEKKFDALENGRDDIEYDDRFQAKAPALKKGRGGSGELRDIDDLLRFYILLFAVRQARQVPDSSLSTCYRYWLAHYYRADRAALRSYVDDYFPTLKKWLDRDTRMFGRFRARPLSRWWRPFFRPGDFWKKATLAKEYKHLVDK
jgi:hypothetical protein